MARSSEPSRPDHLGFEWEESSPRGREVPVELTLRIEGHEIINPIGLRRIARDQKVRWANEYEGGRVSDYSVAKGSVDPLVRAALLAPAETDGELLVLTAKGRATCEAYWRRRREGDPSLPKERVRA